jgi:hypothetical protein
MVQTHSDFCDTSGNPGYNDIWNAHSDHSDNCPNWNNSSECPENNPYHVDETGCHNNIAYTNWNDYSDVPFYNIPFSNSYPHSDVAHLNIGHTDIAHCNSGNYNQWWNQTHQDYTYQDGGTVHANWNNTLHTDYPNPWCNDPHYDTPFYNTPFQNFSDHSNVAFYNIPFVDWINHTYSSHVDFCNYANLYSGDC